MKTIVYLAPIVIALAVCMSCSDQNGCSGSSSNNTSGSTFCGAGTHWDANTGKCLPG